MRINYLIYLLLFMSAIINLVALVRNKHANTQNITTKVSRPVAIANYSILANFVWSLGSVLLKQANIIDFEAYLVTMFVSLIVILLGSIYGVVATVGQFLALRKNDNLVQIALNPKLRNRLLLQLLMFVFGITWVLTDYYMISFTWMDFLVHLVTFDPVQSMPVQGIIYLILIYLVSIYKVTDLLHFKYWRRLK